MVVALCDSLYLQLQAGRRADQRMSLRMSVMMLLSTCVVTKSQRRSGWSLRWWTRRRSGWWRARGWHEPPLLAKRRPLRPAEAAARWPSPALRPVPALQACTQAMCAAPQRMQQHSTMWTPSPSAAQQHHTADPADTKMSAVKYVRLLRSPQHLDNLRQHQTHGCKVCHSHRSRHCRAETGHRAGMKG